MFFVFDLIDTVNTVIYEFDELHFELEIATVFDLLVEILYFLAEVVYTLSQLDGLLFIHCNKRLSEGRY